MSASLGRLGEQPTWADRFATLDAVLVRRLARAAEPDPRIAWAWSRLLGGGAGVTALAAELGWSHRHLADRFRREVGLPPKTVARIVRFSRAYAVRARVEELGGWARVAHAFGYYDQAHLIRDAREFAGVTRGGLSP